MSSSQLLGKPLNSSDPQYTRKEGLSPVPEIPIQRSIHFDLNATPEPRAPSPLPPASKPRKLRKPRPDGYDSDGGYVSDSTKADKPKKKSKKKNKDKGDGDATDFESDGDHLSESSKKKKEKKSKKDKGKSTDGAGTDYESDGGYLSSTSFGRGKKNKSSKKSSSSSLVSGDESDGGYLSEASAKTRRFFGLSPKSSKKKKSSSNSPVQESIPPVPSLPPLPIAEKFSRSLTPSSFDTDRSTTPAPSEFTVTNRSSHDTVVSTMSPPTASSPDSLRGLPNAFKDAESVRSPSIDVLATFGRRTPSNDQVTRRSPHPLSNSPLTPSSSPTRLVPSITSPKRKKNRSMKRTPPQISAPNTSSLSAKHTPVPLILTPPTPLTSSRRISPPSTSLSESHRVDVPDVLVTAAFDSQAVWKPTADVPRTPSPHPSPSSEYIFVSPVTSPLPSPAAPSSPVSGQTLVRPRVLAYYDLPPPSPPPQGPLPTLPPEPVQSRGSNDSFKPSLIPNDHLRTHWGVVDSSSELKQQPPSLIWRTYSRSGTADDERTQSSPPPPVWTTYNRSASGSASAPVTQPSSPYRSPSRSNLAPPSASLNSRPSSPSTTPLFGQRYPQRGRESPFPTQPVLPRNESSELVRRTSVVLANSRSQRTTNDNGRLSPESSQMEKERGLRQQLDARWQPRSASALDTRRVSDEDRRRSWVDYSDDSLEPDLEPKARQGARPVSSDSHADIDSVLSMFRDDEGHGEAVRRSGEKAKPRSTFYFDVDEDDESFNRYSVWSEGARPVSILDAEKSGDAREKFVKQVEAMYQQGDIPPVPPLAPAARNGMN